MYVGINRLKGLHFHSILMMSPDNAVVRQTITFTVGAINATASRMHV